MLDPTPTPRPPSIPVGVGFRYRDRDTGREWVLAGRRSGRLVCLVHNRGGPHEYVMDRVPIADLEAHYDLLGCDHEVACCRIHGTHSTPHKGCVLR